MMTRQTHFHLSRTMDSPSGKHPCGEPSDYTVSITDAEARVLPFCPKCFPNGWPEAEAYLKAWKPPRAEVKPKKKTGNRIADEGGWL